MPFGVKRVIRSVTMDAVPLRSARNRSESGTTHSRWSHGLYFGVKCLSRSKLGNCRFSSARRIPFIRSGSRRLVW
ncbi:Uncharacterised protein [Mycobacteroides abscessus subsp. abscessus]|nr:Uncharacterised protein [Mycobacteroides abscessus subsp. abscessus]